MLQRLPLNARAALWWLALCLLVAPALGRMHQVLHGPAFRVQAMAAPAAGAQEQHAGFASEASPAHGTVEALFGSHTGSTCDLLDLLLFGAFLLPAPWLLPVRDLVPPPQTPPLASASARVLRRFLARAPPAASAVLQA